MMIDGLLASAQVTGCEHPCQNAVELFDWKVLADVAVSAGSQSCVHLIFVITNTGEDNNRQVLIDLTDESNEGDPVHLGHLEIDNYDFAVVLGKPVGSLKSIGKRLAAVAFLAEISDEEPSDARVIIDDEELGGVAW